MMDTCSTAAESAINTGVQTLLQSQATVTIDDVWRYAQQTANDDGTGELRRLLLPSRTGSSLPLALLNVFLHRVAVQLSRERTLLLLC